MFRGCVCAGQSKCGGKPGGPPSGPSSGLESSVWCRKAAVCQQQRDTLPAAGSRRWNWTHMPFPICLVSSRLRPGNLLAALSPTHRVPSSLPGSSLQQPREFASGPAEASLTAYRTAHTFRSPNLHFHEAAGAGSVLRPQSWAPPGERVSQCLGNVCPTVRASLYRVRARLPSPTRIPFLPLTAPPCHVNGCFLDSDGFQSAFPLNSCCRG